MLSFLFFSGADVLNGDVAVATPSPAVGYTYNCPPSVSSDVKHLTSAAMSPASPASSVSSFSMPSQFPKAFQGSNFVVKPLLQTPFPEVNSLSRVLTLSDSWLNYFSDKSYDNVSLCSCCKSSEASRTKGIITKSKDFERCVCGFGPLERMKFTSGTGLFPDDIYEVTSVNLTPAKKDVIVKLEAKAQECKKPLTVRRQGSTTTILPSQIPFSLLEEIVSQCSSPFSCSNLKFQLMYKSQGIVKHVSGMAAQNKGKFPLYVEVDSDNNNRGYDIAKRRYKISF